MRITIAGVYNPRSGIAGYAAVTDNGLTCAGRERMTGKEAAAIHAFAEAVRIGAQGADEPIRVVCENQGVISVLGGAMPHAHAYSDSGRVFLAKRITQWRRKAPGLVPLMAWAHRYPRRIGLHHVIKASASEEELADVAKAERLAYDALNGELAGAMNHC